MAANNPGSYNEFIAREGLTPGPDAILAHSIALDGFREVLAKARGVEVEDLHRLPISYDSTQEAVA